MKAASTKPRYIDDYQLEEKLGKGSFATVHKGRHGLCQCKPDLICSHLVAIKAIARDKLESSRNSVEYNRKLQENLQSEISILTKLDAHKNIVQLFKVHKADKYIYLFLEYCHGGDLSNHIRNCGPFPEPEARRFLADIADGLAVLRRHKMIHRDLKPQNILLSTDGTAPAHEARFTLKIADFGFARYIQPQEMAETTCGSPLYMAPEVLERAHYGAEADLWSVGAIMFEVLTKKPPFTGATPWLLLDNIKKTKALLFPPELRPSDDCADLIRRLLTVNPAARISFDDFFSHRFVDRKDAHLIVPPASLPELPAMPTATVSPAAATPVSTDVNVNVNVNGSAPPAPRAVAQLLPDQMSLPSPLPLPLPLPFQKSEPTPPPGTSRMDVASRASTPLAFESALDRVERRWSDVPAASMVASQRVTPWRQGPLPIPNPITPSGGSVVSSARTKDGSTGSSGAGADFVMVDTESVPQRRASSPLIPPSAFNAQWRQRPTEPSISTIVSQEESAALRRIEPLVVCAQHVVDLADDKMTANQVPVAIALYTKVLEQVHSELCGLQVYASDGAAAVRQALACLFDSAMRKAEAARGALRGGATGSVILPSRVIFEAALEYGRSGAGSEAFGGGTDEYEQALFLLHYLLRQESISEQDRETLTHFCRLLYARLDTVSAARGSQSTRSQSPAF